MSKVIKIKQLIKGITFQGIFNELKTIKICKIETTDWVRRLAMAAPTAWNFGIKMKFIIMFTPMPIIAVMFNNFKLPLAVSKVPNI